MSRRNPFYRRSSLNVETYDIRTDFAGTALAGDVEFFVQHAQQAGGPVLELGSGTGRVSWALAQAGIEVIGLDLSPAMLARAGAKRATMPEDARKLARFVQGDMADFRLDQTFALAIIPYRVFQVLITPEEQRRCLECIHRHLRPGGRLIVNLFDPQLPRCVPDAPFDSQEQTVRHPTTGNAVKVEIIQHSNDPVRQVLTEVWRFTELDGTGQVLRQEEEVLTLRWTHRQEMRYLFELAGFEAEAEFSDFQGSPPAYGREQVWVVRQV
jgi:SAM-dependent methyltransferase